MRGREVWFLVALGFSLISFSQANNRAVGSRSTSFLPRSTPLHALGDSKAERWSWFSGGSYANTFWPDPWRDAASAAVAPTNPSLFPSFNKILGVLKVDGGSVVRVHLTPAPVFGAGLKIGLPLCWELAAMPRQVQDHKADASGCFVESPGLLLQIFMRSMFEYGSKACNFFPMCKDWNLSGTTHGFAVSYHSTSNQFGICLQPIVSIFVLLLQTWYNLAELKKHITILVLLSVKIRLENRMCKNFTQSAPMPSRCGVLLIRKVHDDLWLNGKLKQIDCGMLLFHMDQTAEVSINLELTCAHFESMPMVFAAQGLECQRWSNFSSVNLWSQVNTTATFLKHQLCSHSTKQIHGQQKPSTCLYACKTIEIGNAFKVQYECVIISTCTMFYLLDDQLVEDTVLPLFGLCHQRWTTTSLLLIPRFNGGDPMRLGSVMVPQNLQLDHSQPQVHTPDRPLGEPAAGHQLVWSMMEALEDCRCSNIESVLSADERSLFGFICNLRYQLQLARSSFFHFVRLGTFDPHSTPCRRDMLYYEL